MRNEHIRHTMKDEYIRDKPTFLNMYAWNRHFDTRNSPTMQWCSATMVTLMTKVFNNAMILHYYGNFNDQGL